MNSPGKQSHRSVKQSYTQLPTNWGPYNGLHLIHCEYCDGTDEDSPKVLRITAVHRQKDELMKTTKSISL